MGYREEVACAYQADCWNELVDKVQSSMFTDAERKELIELLNDADCHSVTDTNDHCLTWDSIKTYTSDSALLFDRMHSALSGEWYCVMLGDDGSDEVHGEWYENPFGLSVSHSLNVDHGTQTTKSCGIELPLPAIAIDVAPVTQAINDHTCVRCGNTACSKTEKSCWKCGETIS